MHKPLRDIAVMTTNRIIVLAFASAVMANALSAGPAMAKVTATATAASAGKYAGIVVAAVVCGNAGCAPVQTKSAPRRKMQWLGHG